jgi:AcrR family transcriptional regulator
MQTASPHRLKRADRTRRQILDAGLRLFSRHGYDRASMDDIALELEATKGLLYHYFRSKHEILAAILQEHPLRIAIESIEAAVEGRDLNTALSLVTSESLYIMRENRAFIRFLMLETHSSREQAEVVFRELTDRWTAAYEAVIAAHTPAEERPLARLLARQLVDIILAAFIRSELGGGDQADDLEEYLQEAVETVITRIKARD